MNKLACRYAIVQFLPYPETGEFANVGVALLCPEAKYFGYRLQTRRIGRVTAFFEDVGRTTYSRALRLFAQELERAAKGLAEVAFAHDDPEAARLAFGRLIHPREAIVRFAPQRVYLAEAPEAALEHLFGHYVDHEFVTREYQENQLEKRIAAMLRTMALNQPFHPQVLGNDEVHARFPFVQGGVGAAEKLIKPFFLAQDEPNRIYDHADPWLQKMRRLRSRNLLPRRVLFTLDGPPASDTKRYHAFDEIRQELMALDFEVTEAEEGVAITRFARS
ncbi:MAG: DUF3037 domain-containing protein [Pseudomonadota bacterium]|nr:DUF3037 domain-containing protein [Pseudomonadota bacterium]